MADTPEEKWLEVTIWRGESKPGGYRAYRVPARKNQTVLDVVTWIQRNMDSSLTYRFACRVGMCGSCAMTVNGRPRWTCRSHVDQVSDTGKLVIEPLNNMHVVKDLACDMQPFFDKWTGAGGHFKPTADRADPMPAIRPDSRERRSIDAAIECINCGVCFAACDVVENNPDYFGPAALNRAWTLQNDSRDGGRRERLRAVAGNGGCQNCHSQQSCSRLCPNSLSPTRSIAGLKRSVFAAALKGEG